MKRTLSNILLAWTLILATGLGACTDDADDYADEIYRSLGGKADITFAIPKSATSRLSTTEAQINGTFNGIENIKLFAVETVTNSINDSAGVANSAYISQIENITDFSNFDNRETYSGVKIYRNIRFPAHDYRNIRYVFYGESAYASATGELNYSPVATPLTKLDDVRFSLTPYGEPTLLNEIANKIADVLNEIDSLATLVTQPLNNMVALKDSLLNADNVSHLGSNTHPISEYGLEVLLGYLYNEYRAMGYDVTDPNKLKALKALATYARGTNIDAYAATLLPKYKNFLGGYPQGAYFLTMGCNTYKTGNYASFSTRTDELYTDSINQIMKGIYCKPASLWYYGNGYLVDEDNGNSYENWINGKKNVYGSVTLDSIANPATSGSLAFSHSIHYGVAVAKSSITLTNCKVAEYFTSRVDQRFGVEIFTQGKDINVGNGELILTGIIFSNQRDSADYKFDPRTTSNDVSVFDTCLVGSTNITINGVYKPITVRGKALNASNEGVCYTTLLPSRKIESPLTDDSIKVALELVNNTGKIIIGKDNTTLEPIKQGATFYIIGKFKYSEGTILAGAAPNRIFQSDYYTNINMTLGDLTEANLYGTIPDLRHIVASIAISVDLTWNNGDYYRPTMGK